PGPVRAARQPVLLDGPDLGRRRDRPETNSNRSRPFVVRSGERAARTSCPRCFPDVSRAPARKGVAVRLFDTVLVANRGEIAVRVLRTLRRLGIRSIAVYSDADRTAAHVHAADVAVHLGASPAGESYLHVERIVRAAQRTGAQAI